MKQAQELGIIRKYGSIQEYKKALNGKLSGKHFYTNGIIDKKFSDTDIIPEGFYRGRSNGCGAFTTGRIAVNNGSNCKFIFPGDPIPDGYVLGQLKHSEDHNKKISEALTGKVREEDHCLALSKSHKTLSYKNKIEQTCLD